ncbi:hypothetical protein FXO37_29530 [Capsicum annuum]|nr:hypothetical protein FXO37_29530 [Capsicum annuum]
MHEFEPNDFKNMIDVEQWYNKLSKKATTPDDRKIEELIVDFVWNEDIIDKEESISREVRVPHSAYVYPMIRAATYIRALPAGGEVGSYKSVEDMSRLRLFFGSFCIEALLDYCELGFRGGLRSTGDWRSHHGHGLGRDSIRRGKMHQNTGAAHLAQLQATMHAIELACSSIQMHMNPAAAEETILSLSQSPRPYQACKYILENSQLANARFQAAGAIRDAALREWAFLEVDDKRELIRPFGRGIVSSIFGSMIQENGEIDEDVTHRIGEIGMRLFERKSDFDGRHDAKSEAVMVWASPLPSSIPLSSKPSSPVPPALVYHCHKLSTSGIDDSHCSPILSPAAGLSPPSPHCSSDFAFTPFLTLIPIMLDDRGLCKDCKVISSSVVKNARLGAFGGRFISDKRNCTRLTRGMREFSDFIEDMCLIVLELEDAKYTWFKGENHEAASRIDRILIFEEWDDAITEDNF